MGEDACDDDEEEGQLDWAAVLGLVFLSTGLAWDARSSRSVTHPQCRSTWMPLFTLIRNRPRQFSRVLIAAHLKTWDMLAQLASKTSNTIQYRFVCEREDLSPSKRGAVLSWQGLVGATICLLSPAKRVLSNITVRLGFRLCRPQSTTGWPWLVSRIAEKNR